MTPTHARTRDPGRRPRAGRVGHALAALVAVALAGCFDRWGASLGNSVVNAVKKRSGEVVQPITDSVGAQLPRVYRDSLKPRVDSLVTGLFDTVQVRQGRMQDSLATYLEGRLNRSVNRLLTDNIGLVRDSVDRALAVWLNTAGNRLRAEVVPLAGELSSSAVSHAVASLDSGIKGPLRSTLIALVREMADTIRAEARKSSQEVVEPWYKRVGTLAKIIAGAIVLAVLAGGIFVWAALRRSRKALEAVTTAIHDRGDDDLRAAVKAAATQRQVEDYLHDFLEKRDLLPSRRGTP